MNMRFSVLAPLLSATTCAAIVFAPAASAATPARTYATHRTCTGYPRVDLETPRGWCVAMLADASAGLRFPRRVLEVARGRYWLVDMGSWEPRQGRLLEFTLPASASTSASAQPVTFTVLAEKLDRPLGLVHGPDGQVWVGEAGRISRTPIGVAASPVRLQVVIDGLPDDGSHPLKELAFGSDGKLYFTVGSASDACRDAGNALPVPCPQLAGSRPRAAIWQATFGGADHTLQSVRPYATGLRNSVALAWAPGADMLLQGENSIDYPDAAQPPEELNVVRDGAFYGWPYCVGARTPARGYEGRFDCAGKSEAPSMPWPAHAAPLQMQAYAKGAPHAFAGQLLVAWHGYRETGHRIVSYEIDANGRPSGKPTAWIGGWAAKTGVRPLGAPTGFSVDTAGRMLVVEDRKRTLLMLVRESAPR